MSAASGALPISQPQPCDCPTRDYLDRMLSEMIKRRSTVEQSLYDMAAGKTPMPDVAKLRELAQHLGVPSSCAHEQQGRAHLQQQLADLRGQRGAMAALMRELLQVVLTIDEPESDDEAQLLLDLETKTTAMLAEIDRQAAGSLLVARIAPQLPHPKGAS